MPVVALRSLVNLERDGHKMDSTADPQVDMLRQQVSTWTGRQHSDEQNVRAACVCRSGKAGLQHDRTVLDFAPKMRKTLPPSW
jgi:hypothetical protein